MSDCSHQGQNKFWYSMILQGSKTTLLNKNSSTFETWKVSFHNHYLSCHWLRKRAFWLPLLVDHTFPHAARALCTEVLRGSCWRALWWQLAPCSSLWFFCDWAVQGSPDVTKFVKTIYNQHRWRVMEAWQFFRYYRSQWDRWKRIMNHPVSTHSHWHVWVASPYSAEQPEVTWEKFRGRSSFRTSPSCNSNLAHPKRRMSSVALYLHVVFSSWQVKHCQWFILVLVHPFWYVSMFTHARMKIAWFNCQDLYILIWHFFIYRYAFDMLMITQYIDIHMQPTDQYVSTPCVKNQHVSTELGTVPSVLCSLKCRLLITYVFSIALSKLSEGTVLEDGSGHHLDGQGSCGVALRILAPCPVKLGIPTKAMFLNFRMFTRGNCRKVRSENVSGMLEDVKKTKTWLVWERCCITFKIRIGSL